MPYWKNYTSRISITYLQIAFSKMSLVQEFALNTVPPWPTKITKCNFSSSWFYWNASQQPQIWNENYLIHIKFYLRIFISLWNFNFYVCLVYSHWITLAPSFTSVSLVGFSRMNVKLWSNIIKLEENVFELTGVFFKYISSHKMWGIASFKIFAANHGLNCSAQISNYFSKLF